MLYKVVLYIHPSGPSVGREVYDSELLAAFRGFDPTPSDVRAVSGVGWVTFLIEAHDQAELHIKVVSIVRSLNPLLAVNKLYVPSWLTTIPSVEEVRCTHTSKIDIPTPASQDAPHEATMNTSVPIHLFYSPHALAEQFVHREAIINCLRGNRAAGYRSIYVKEYAGFSPSMADSIGLPPLAVIQRDQELAQKVETWYQELLANQERIATEILRQSNDVSSYRANSPGQQEWSSEAIRLLASLADEGVEQVFCERVPSEVCLMGREVQKNERQRALQAYAIGRPSDAFEAAQAYFIARKAIMEKREMAFAALLKSILTDPDIRIVSTRGTHHYLYRQALDQIGLEYKCHLPPLSVFTDSEPIPHPDHLLLRNDAYGEPVDQELVIHLHLQYVLHRFLSTYFMSTGNSMRDADVAARRTLDNYPVTIDLFNDMSIDVARSGRNRNAKSVGEFVFEALQKNAAS